MTTPVQFALLATTSVFTVVNPFSAAPLFISLTGRFSKRDRKRVARKACLAAAATLLVFAGAGTLLFRFFGITTPAFQITGGLLFMLMSIRVLQGRPEIEDADGAQTEPSIVPLAIPILSGPGAITTVVVLGGQAVTPLWKLLIVQAVLITMAVTYIVLRSAPRLMELIGEEGRRAGEKILALITGVIGVQFMIDGITPVVVGILQAASGKP